MIILIISFTFLSVPEHSRVILSGGAFSSYKGELENLFWNPAGIGGEGYLSSSYNYSGVTYGCLGMVKQRSQFHFGIGLQSLYSGDMKKTSPEGEPLGEFSYYSLIPIASVTYNWNGLSVGGKLLIPYVNTDTYHSYGVGMDVGLLYEVNKEITLSFYGRNIGRQIKGFVESKENLPAEFRIGSLYKRNKLGFSLEYSFSFGPAGSIIYEFNDWFDLTMGYNNGIRDKNSGNGLSVIDGGSMGVRFYYKKIIIDIGSVFYGPLGIGKTIAIGYGG